MCLQYKLWSIINVKSPGCGNPSCGFINKCYIYFLFKFGTDRFPLCHCAQALYAVCAVTDIINRD